MRLPREALLAIIVTAVVLYLYIVAGGAVLYGICGFASPARQTSGCSSAETRGNLN